MSIDLVLPSFLLKRVRAHVPRDPHARGSRRVSYVAAGLAVSTAGAIWLGLWLTREAMEFRPKPLGQIEMRFEERGYDLADVMKKGSPVPRIFVARMPRDWAALDRVDARKLAFTKLLLPIVLRVNERLAGDRARLRRIAERLAAGESIPRTDRRWLDRLAGDYETDPRDLRTLLMRVDGVPPSLAIAQAAIESGWGTSRFVVEGNALFGQWTEEADQGLVPAGRDPGRTYAIKRFDTLTGSVEAYVRNLNTHRAYRQFRRARALQRRAGDVPAGFPLAAELRSYSQDGKGYVRTLRAIIKKNNLAALDRVALMPCAEELPDACSKSQ